MIELKDWLRQIIGYCEFVTNEVKLRQAWIRHDFSETSVTGFDELYEQVFDDLDGDRFVNDLDTNRPNATQANAAIVEFLKSLHEIDRIRSELPELLNAAVLLDSDQWQQVRRAALKALDTASHDH